MINLVSYHYISLLGLACASVWFQKLTEMKKITGRPHRPPNNDNIKIKLKLKDKEKPQSAMNSIHYQDNLEKQN
jgi:hypothetical protein